MAPPPTKKQKRLNVLSSNDSSEAEPHLHVSQVLSDSSGRGASGTVQKASYSTKTLPTRSRDATKPVIQKSQSTVSASSVRSTLDQSPQKPKKKPQVIQDDHKQGSLHTFFNAVTQSQRLGGTLKDVTPKHTFEEEDFIQDELLEEDLHTLPQERYSPKHAIDGRKRTRTLPSSHEAPVCTELQPNASQRFNKTLRKQEHTQYTATVEQADLRPWAERYAPTCLDELAVHKKKVVDVGSCLEEAFLGRNRKVWNPEVSYGFKD